MSKQIPKAVKVEMSASILKVQFDNGQIKYLKSHYNDDIVDSVSPKKGKGKRLSLFLASHNSWLGTTTSIENDGTVVLNEKDKYTAEELWTKGKEHITEL